MSVRLLLDENLSERLISALEPKFAGARHVRPLALGGASDLAIWAHAIARFTEHEDAGFLALGFGPRSS